MKAWLTLLLLISTVQAHEVRPALLQLTQIDDGHYDILWKQPVNGDVAVHLKPHLSGGELEASPLFTAVTPSYATSRWRNVATALDGETVSIEGLEHTITDVLISVRLANGRSIQTLLRPQQPALQLELTEQFAPAAPAYLSLGIEHILTGADHLLFVFGLLLLVGGSWNLLKTITSFTAAHSITLGATALGWMHVSPSVVEVLVALSIVTLAVELVRRSRGEIGLTSRHPWLIAFLFGLLHGCAFAGALAQVGLPREHIPLALFLFNVGVEVGQVAFIAFAVAGLWLLRRWLPALPSWARLGAPYTIGIFSSYWLIERFFLAVGVSA